MKNALNIAAAIAILAASVCTGCKLDYKDADIADTLAEEIPDSTLENFSQTVLENGKTVYSLSADYAEIYNGKGVTRFSNIGFIEYSADEKASTRGAAERADLYPDTDNIVFDGRIILDSESQDFVIKSDYLEWNDEKKILKSRDSTHVVIERGDKTKVEGHGFIADAQSRTFKFLDKSSGRFVEDEETD